MPELNDVVVINVALETAAMPAREWGVPAIVGESTYAEKNKPKLYTSLSALANDHGSASDSPLTRCAAAVFAQGVRKLYAVSMDVATPGSPTPSEIEAALNSLGGLADAGKIGGVCLADITSDEEGTDDGTNYERLCTRLKGFADTHNLIFTVTNANGESVSDILTDAGELASPNGFYVAHADPDVDEDVAGAALGVLMTLKPWITPMWKPINVGVNEYFTPDGVAQLEGGKVNAIIELSGNRLSNGLTTGGDPKFIDITRTKYLTIARIREELASLRLRVEKIPFTEAGLTLVEQTIVRVMNELVRIGALAEHTVVVPTLDEISDSDKANRILRNVYVSGRLAGDIHTFELNLTLTV